MVHINYHGRARQIIFDIFVFNNQNQQIATSFSEKECEHHTYRFIYI
jgi:hypothetical protein